MDWENVAEEIESLGVSERRSLATHIASVVEHLMQLQASPADRPRAGWRMTILRERRSIRDILDESPSLRREVAAIIARQTARTHELISEVLAARTERPRVDPATLTYTEDQVLGKWLPD